MSLSFSVQIILTVIASLLLLILFQCSQNTRVFHKPPSSLQGGFISARLDLALRLTASLLALFGPFYIAFMDMVTLLDIVIPLALFPAVIGLLINPELSIDTNSKLVITKPLLSKTATLHLKSPYQHFDRQTYQELLHLVQILPEHGIKHIKLNSPMFYHANGKLRCMAILEKGLDKRGARLIHSPAGAFDCFLGKISMLLSTDQRKKAGLANINLRSWYTLNIEL